ncbi:putative phage tail protein [Bacillus sp. FJAT-49736]|uniref:putative phage tail protein n=1 Tax=Bacillus sp. FJAT-49736 TaxID=2833582 RepID=UPI001BC931A5|nr:putative phage tail protein [Bacillus sp. FJAT-49736]MBS4172132.1 DUF2313 domain-containing protein [Bacillus sp. FJAT-49736]
MADSLMSYLPEFYNEIIDFIELTKTEDIEIKNLNDALDLFFNNQFIISADEESIKRREDILLIQADPTTESLDFRRKRIINRYSTSPPFSIRYLQERLDFLIGKGRAITAVDFENYILTVTLSIEDALIFKEVQYTIQKIKPANIVYIQRTSIKDAIEFNENIKTRPMLRNTRLSTTWKLGKTPFVTLGEEVVIK